eukprot:scaffold81540_cov60-Phaeocystis_antarctica.AAC.2
MHDQTITTYGMLLQHGNRSPQKKATLTSNIGALHGKRSQHQKNPALTKFNGAHLLKWLAAFCVLDCVGASEFGESPGASSTNHPAACPPQWLPVLLATLESPVPPPTQAPPQPSPSLPPPLRPPSPPQPPPSPPLAPFADEPCTTSSTQEDRCKVTLKIEARLLSSLRPCTSTTHP